jgi:poly(3-hydroxybutyrate) depolymerase
MPTRREILALSAIAGTGLALPASPALAAPTTAPQAIAGATLVTLPSGRKYWLTGALGGGAARALVVGLTFSGHDATWMHDVSWVTGNAATTGWRRHAATANYTLAMPEPVDNAWNAGKGPVGDPNPNGWPGSGQDDVQALLDVVADASARTPIDPSRVFVAGGSAGGAMAARASIERPDVFAAAAMASGWVPYRWPTQPWDCYAVHGCADVTVPIRGGVGADGYVFPSLYAATVRAPRGSRVGLYLTDGGHAVPGWFASATWNFWTGDRARP